MLKCESGSNRFQPGEGPSRSRDYEPSCGPSFEALLVTGRRGQHESPAAAGAMQPPHTPAQHPAIKVKIGSVC